MNILAACILALAVGCASASNNDNYPPVGNYITDLINKTLNSALAKLADPIVVSNVSQEFTNSSLFSGGFDINEITISGIKGLIASQINVGLFTLSLNMTIDIPDLNVTLASYWLDLLLLELVPLYGSGEISIDLKGIQFHITGKVHVTKESVPEKDLLALHVQNVHLLLTADSGTVYVTGLLYNDDFSNLISSVLSDIFVDFLDNNAAFISRVISPIAEKAINGLFNNPHLSDEEKLDEIGDCFSAQLTM